MLRIHIDPPPTTRKPKKTTTLRPTDTTTERSSNTRFSTIQQNPTFSTKEVEVFGNNAGEGPSTKNDNLKIGDLQTNYEFSVKENQARK